MTVQRRLVHKLFGHVAYYLTIELTQLSRVEKFYELLETKLDVDQLRFGHVLSAGFRSEEFLEFVQIKVVHSATGGGGVEYMLLLLHERGQIDHG